MLEGLWTVEFLTPQDPDMDLNGGVIVIESGRVLGGDSGYYYIGDIGSRAAEKWPINLKIGRHDPNITSIFGDTDNFNLEGVLQAAEADEWRRPILLTELSHAQSGIVMTGKLVKVAELP